ARFRLDRRYLAREDRHGLALCDAVFRINDLAARHHAGEGRKTTALTLRDPALDDRKGLPDIEKHALGGIAGAQAGGDAKFAPCAAGERRQLGGHCFAAALRNLTSTTSSAPSPRPARARPGFSKESSLPSA